MTSNLSEHLASISEQEMDDAFHAMQDFQEKEGGLAWGGALARIGTRYPALGSLMRMNDEAFLSDPKAIEAVAGFQFAAGWIGTVAERRDDKSLDTALVDVPAEALGRIAMDYQDEEIRDFKSDFKALSVKYPLVESLLRGFQFLAAHGAMNSGPFLMLTGVCLAKFADEEPIGASSLCSQT